MNKLYPRTKIELKELLVTYDNQTALVAKDNCFEGNVIALIGHNGAGKSTLIKSILGLLQPKAGSISVSYQHNEDSHFIQIAPEVNMAFCPESGAVFSDISVESYIKLWCRLKKGNSKFYMNEGAMYLEALDIPVLLKKLGRELSKGQKRRVQTAIGFLIEPKLFLIDEPFDGLDVQKTHELVTLIHENAKKTTFVISSHRMDVMERVSDYVIVLKNGGVISCGGVEEVCLQLGEITYYVDAHENAEDLQQIFETAFRDQVVNRVGGYVTITGKGLKPEIIMKASKDLNIDATKISHMPPSLVDAMTYHLKH